jgi:hypothetical protein
MSPPAVNRLQTGQFATQTTRGFLIRFPARDLGRLSMIVGCDVVLDLLVDHHHDREDDQGLGADRQRDDPG